MYAQLGNIRFEGLKGFSTFEKTYGVNYAQHERIQGKPRLQAVGSALDTISFSMFLHKEFTNPEEDIEALKIAMNNNEILPLVLGNGRVVGNFVIPNLTETQSFTDSLGNIIEATLQVELLESFTEDLLLQSQQQQREKAFATTTRNSNVRSVLTPKISPAMAVTKGIADIDVSGSLIQQHTAVAVANPSTLEYYSAKINSTLDSVEAGLTKVQNTMSGNPSLTSFQTPAFITAANNVYTSVQNIKNVFPVSDINDFKSLVSALKNSTRALKTANAGLSNQSVIRRL